MAKKYASLTTLQNLVDNIKVLFVKKTDLETTLSGYDKKGSAATVQENLNTVNDTLSAHTENANIHVTTANKTNWNSAYTHSTSAHARADATKVEDSATNGNIKINGTETNVYSHPNSSVSAGTYKSVTVNAQGHVTGGSNPTTLEEYGIIDGETKGTASSAVSTHNTNTASHADIRDLITGLTTRLNTIANSDDTTLDQLSEIVAYIKNNKSLIDGVTTNKVNVSDIVNNLTTNVTNKPLSAAQGVEINRLIDALQSSLQSSLDSHAADTTKHITSTERTNWNTAKTHADSAHAPSNAQPNQNAFSNIAVSGQTTVAADTTTDTVTFAGSNVSITTDATNDKVTFSVADGTTSVKGVVQLTDSTSSTSTTTAATPKNVKAAYDLANTAKTNAATAQSKADSAYTLAEGKVDSLSDLGITATATELNYLDGVTSNVQVQLDSKLEAITGAASTIVSDDLTTNRVLISDNYGKVCASNISGGELSRLSGATKNIQEQIDDLDEAVDNKVSKYGDTMTGSLAIEPTSTTSPLISLIGNANASGQQAKSRIRKGTNSSVDNGTEVVDETFDGRKTSLILQSNKDLDKNRLRLKLTASDGTYEEYNLYGEHYKPTAADLGALENSSYDLHSFVTDRSVMSASNIVGDDVMPFVDVSLRSGRKITVNELLKYLKNNSGVASVATVTAAEYSALEEAEATNANTLYMITDAEEETPTQVQIVTWGDDD